MSKHLKRLKSPRTWKMARKNQPWAIKPRAGKHPANRAIPLGIIIRDYLNLAESKKEAKRICAEGEIKVDGRIRKDYKFSCGLMDVISIPKMKKHFRVLFNKKGKLVLVNISEKDAKWKLRRIKNKTHVKNGKTQLNFHDGENKIVEKDEYGSGDVVKIDLKENKMKDTYKLKKGNISMITGGKHIGEIADIKKLEIVPSSKPNRVTMKDGKKEFTTIKSYVLPIGKNKSVINTPEVKIQ